MKQSLLFILFLFLSSFASAQQPFEKIIYSDRVETGNIVKKCNNGYIIAGRASDSSFNIGCYLLRTDMNGNRIWDKLFLDGYSLNTINLVACNDGGFAVTCVVGFPNDDTTLVMKVDSMGAIEWSQKFYYGTGDFCRPEALIQTGDGGFALLGLYRNIIGTFSEETFLAKFNGSGNLQWTKKFDHGTGNFLSCYDLTEDLLGNLYITGANKLFSEGSLILKTDASGNILDVHLFRTNSFGYRYPQHISARSDGSFDIAFGNEFGVNTDQVLFLHVNTSGQVLDARFYGVTDLSQFRDVYRMSDTEFLLTGNSTNSIFNTDAVMMKVNQGNGTVDWGRTYGANGYDVGNSAIVDGINCVMVGNAQDDSLGIASGSYPTDLFLLKTNQNGNIACFTNSIATTVTNITVADSAYSLNTADVTSSTIVTAFIPVIKNFYQDTVICTGVSVSEVNNNHEFQLFPDPAADHVKIVMQTFDKDAQVIITSITGQIIDIIDLDQPEIDVDLKRYEGGLYIVRLVTHDSQSIRKLIVNH